MLPAIADVGRPLLFTRTVRKADRVKAARFVEAAGAGVGLKAPDFERVDAASLGSLDELGPSTAADAIGTGMEEAHFLAPSRKRFDQHMADRNMIGFKNRSVDLEEESG